MQNRQKSNTFSYSHHCLSPCNYGQSTHQTRQSANGNIGVVRIEVVKATGEKRKGQMKSHLDNGDRRLILRTHAMSGEDTERTEGRTDSGKEGRKEGRVGETAKISSSDYVLNRTWDHVDEFTRTYFYKIVCRKILFPRQTDRQAPTDRTPQLELGGHQIK